jgi:hypothetical protein
VREKFADPHGVALPDPSVHHGNLVPGLGGRDDPAAEPPLQRLDRLDVVLMPMGDDDVAEPPAGAFKRVEDRLLFRRVHCGAGAGGRIVDQRADVVGEAAENANLGSHRRHLGL